MQDRELLAHSLGDEEYALQQLHYWLAYEGLTFLGGSAAFWFPYRLVFTVLVVLAAVFAPYMLWQLARARWFKSIAVFVLVVLLPFVGSRFVAVSDPLVEFLFLGVPLAAFYIYAWILRLVLGEHLSERRWVRTIEYEHERNSA